MSTHKSNLISIHYEISEKINFACHQCAFPLIHDLRIENLDKENHIEDVDVILIADPAFIKPKTWRLDKIASDGCINIKHKDIELNGGFLLELVDSMCGTLTIRVEKEGQVLAEENKPIELLAYNEWGGSGFMPELLAAFSVPNDPAIDRILHSASVLLRKAQKKDSMEGYQSGSRERVWEIVSAIYTAIANLGITYAVPPASFEQNGQKIRLPGNILEGGIATCLDTAMLFSSALEQAGFNPIIAMPKDHAVVGVWLQPEEFSTIIIDDAEIIRKRCQLKELILIETTYVTSYPSPPFSKAIETAEQTISTDKEEIFRLAVDIKRARAHRITPLGLKSERQNTDEAIERKSGLTLSLEEAPSLPDFDQGIEKEELPDTPIARLERWQKKLLDLSARNPLLNHKSSKTSLKLICPDLAKLEDKLSDGARISINAIPKMRTLAQDETLHQQRTGEVITDEYALSALEKNQVLVNLPELELTKCITEIYRKAQTSLQEGGANTLYLALGFLSWKRDEKDERRYRAPLILVPVTLERKSVRSGVKMIAHDDESRFNTTLLEMLQKDFGVDIRGLSGQLPEDKSGIDVQKIWNQVRLAVKEVPGFEVVEEVVLGHFSFAKYLMWKDLIDRTEALKKNPVVRHLIDNPRDSYAPQSSFVDRNEIDKLFKPTDLFLPLEADSSQVAAIATADRGKDFIIIGPPGTGKSQTISNLIAHMLGKGKTVLFVSEKTAALDVVYRRLKDIGLGKFCLELHSNKARKTEVLNQLDNVWSSAQSKTAEAWEKESLRLEKLRNQLNKVVAHLHQKHGNGLTPHYAIGLKIKDEMLASRLSLSWPRANFHGEQQLFDMKEAVEQLQIQALAIGTLTNTPFQLISFSDWSPPWQAKVVECAGQLSMAAREAEQSCLDLCKGLNITLADYKMSRLDSLGILAKVLIDSYRKQTAYALESDGQDRLEALEQANNHLKRYLYAQSKLSCEYDSLAWKRLDGKQLAILWQSAHSYWWLKQYFLKRSIVKTMRKGGAKSKPNPAKDCVALKRLREHGEAIEGLDKLLNNFKGWKQYDTQLKTTEELHDLGQRLRFAVSGLSDEIHGLSEIKNSIKIILHDGNDLLAPDAAVGKLAKKYLEALEKLHSTCDSFQSIAGQSVRDFIVNSNKALDTIQHLSETISSRHNELRDWCAWRKRRDEVMDYGLTPLIDAIEANRIPLNEICETFEAAYCAWWSAAVIAEDDVLRTFSTPEHMAVIQKFREIDKNFQMLTGAYVDAKLSGQIPAQDDVQKSSGWGVLRHEIQKKTRHKPIRKLMEEIPEVVTSLAPCLMMSPISVAQYIPAEHALFDVVIFDEASQITVWDAVGTIARGKQIIVAGDPKQMPPTNFFNRSDDDPDGDVNYEGDLESVLDELRSSNIPECYLNLHYRSRQESLIAFSNKHYYDNSLITFPAPIHPDCGVKLQKIDGYYARGKARHNEAEAKAIVQEVVRRLKSTDPEIRNLSIGIVTFNTEQQSLIEDLLDKACKDYPEIENAFSEEKHEKVFVKNLETVQGDERDVILFSITYGPDQSGHVTMNFGPLNRTGGERRLNVAMTRARHEMIVFSTLESSHIDLSRTNARAVADLKNFLEYAERGASVLGAAIQGPLGDFESPFEIAVARALRDRGWSIHPQVGVSAFRIDLGVVHPDKPGVYLAGVECDGAMYHSSANARERDKIRQSVLENLGWTLFRVWSTDWWVNKAAAIDKLHSLLQQQLEKVKKQEQENSAKDVDDKVG